MAVKVRALIPGQSGCRSRSNRCKFVRNRETFVADNGECEVGAPPAVLLAEDAVAVVPLVWIVLCGLAGARVDLDRVMAVVLVWREVIVAFFGIPSVGQRNVSCKTGDGNSENNYRH